MRGLKHRKLECHIPDIWSHLLQMRGLKQIFGREDALTTKSHLLQMRGLKHSNEANIATYFVASFTDAWIET